MSEAELYLCLALAALLMSLLPAVVFFFCRMPRKKKKEVLVEMGLQMGLSFALPISTICPISTVVGSQMVVPALAEQQQLETGLAWNSGLPTYEEATMKSGLADIGLDCQY